MHGAAFETRPSSAIGGMELAVTGEEKRRTKVRARAVSYCEQHTLRK